MSDEIKHLLKYGFWVGLITLVVLVWIDTQFNFENLWFNIETMRSGTGYIGESFGLSMIFLGLYERLLWRYNPFENHPRLYGKYDGFIESNYNGKKIGNSVIIDQTLLTCSVKQNTKESFSRSISASIITRDNVDYLVYTYVNDPNANHRKHSEIHYGTSRIRIDENNNNRLIGDYFTDRETTGTITLNKRSK